MDLANGTDRPNGTDGSNGTDGTQSTSANWIFFLRQLFACSTIVSNLFMFGLYTGAPTVVIPQIRKEANSTDAVTPEMASWLSSGSAYSAVPWGIILPLIAHRFGRKAVLILLTLNVLVGNIFFYCSTTVTELMISQVIQGMLTASVLTVTIMVISEYTSPKYRGILFTIKSATFFWGIWVSNAIGTYFHWKNIGIVIFICCIYNLSSIFLYESPYWLATNGKFHECAKIHRWLKGTDKNSEEELNRLILSQKEHFNVKAELNGRLKERKIIKLLSRLQYRGFYIPLIYTSFLIGLYNFSGKIACTVYSLDIIKKITSDEETAYKGMLVLDGITVLGMYVGCALSKIFTRRKQLLVLSCIGVSFLYILSIYLYMIKLNVISENKFFSLFFLVGFSMSISCGPIIVTTCCSAELSPLRYRSFFLCCVSLVANIIYATILKITPLIFKRCGTHGAFLFYAISATTFTLLLYKFLPETKDKTIQEIEEYFSKTNHETTAKTEILPLKQPTHLNIIEF